MQKLSAYRAEKSEAIMQKSMRRRRISACQREYYIILTKNVSPTPKKVTIFVKHIKL